MVTTGFVMHDGRLGLLVLKRHQSDYETVPMWHLVCCKTFRHV